jgi:rod shape-determining protein MreC
VTVLPVDSFSRTPAGAPRRRLTGVSTFVLLLVSLALLVLSRIEHPLVHAIRRHVAEAATPVIAPLADSLGPVHEIGRRLSHVMSQSDEIERLRMENQALRGWETRARELERRHADLATLSRLVAENAAPLVSARVVADANGPFARSVIINAGRNSGLRDGYPAMSADGLVGRVLEAGSKVSRLLLLTDVNSRIPVLIGESSVRAILAGDNTSRPRITLMPADTKVAPGDLVVTSGLAGQFPRGLRIGVVVRDEMGLRVDMDARLDALEHVSILLHDVPTVRPGVEERSDLQPAGPDGRKLARRSGASDAANGAATRQR